MVYDWIFYYSHCMGHFLKNPFTTKKINSKVSQIAYLIANGIPIPHYSYHNNFSIAGN
jgi:hypothetical protein